jgi:hypothetical protein
MNRLVPSITLSFALFPALALGACHFEIQEGSGEIVEETREIDAFSVVHVASGLCAHVSEGEGGTARLVGDDNLLDEVAVTVDDDGELHIQPVERRVILAPTECIAVHVATEQLVAAHASGGAELVAERVVAEEPRVSASGGAQLFLGEVLGDTVRVELSGGSEALAAGLANELHVEASGGSHARLSLLETDAVMVDASGGSVVEVHANEAVLGDASGGSTVTVSGDAALITVDASGGSSVDRE